MPNPGIGRPRLRAFIGLLLSALAAIAQSLTSGGIGGTVADPSGAVIPQADVAVTNTGTGARQSATTNGQGYYRFSFLGPGTYSVEASAPGFEAMRKVVQVRIGEITTVDFKLDIAATASSVTVHATVPPAP